MAKVLIVSAADLRSELSRTVLGGADIELLLAPDLQAGLEIARIHKPKLVIVSASDVAQAGEFVRRIREDPATRHAGVVVLVQTIRPNDEESLRRAGANTVLVGRVDPFLWNKPLGKLLHVAGRREVSIPLRLWVWFRFSPDEQPTRALCVNLSVHGMLLEVVEPLEAPMGTKLEVEFQLPGRDTVLDVLGEVVREAGSQKGRSRFGIKFLNLRGDVRETIADFAGEVASST
jgi:CheY-like chemotaxis protein